MTGPLFKREARANYKLVLLFMGILTVYGALIVAMYDPELGKSLQMMAESMPELFSAFQMQSPGNTLLEFVGNYLYGFILIVIPLLFIVLMASRLVARYIDRGSMAYLLATPHKRRSIIATQGVFMALGTLLLVVYVTVLVLFCGGAMFDEQLDVGRFLLLNAGLYGLLLFMAGLCFLSVCCFDQTKLSCGLGAGSCIAFILLQMLSQVGDKMDWLKYLTPLTLFDAGGLIAGETGAVAGFLVLYALGTLLFLSGGAIFCRRDLPL